MGARTTISIEEYLHTSFEDGDCEYVDGEVVPKPMPPKSHSKVQRRLIEIFYEIRGEHLFHVFPELRERVTASRVRIPDVSIYAGPEPEAVRGWRIHPARGTTSGVDRESPGLRFRPASRAPLPQRSRE